MVYFLFLLFHIVAGAAISSLQRNSLPKLKTNHDAVPHRYIVKLRDNVSETSTYLHKEAVNSRQEQLASSLHHSHPFFGSVAQEPGKYGGIVDHLNSTENFYIGYFTDEMAHEIHDSDLVELIEQDHYLSSAAVIPNSLRPLTTLNSEANPMPIPKAQLLTPQQQIQKNADWSLSRITSRVYKPESSSLYKFLSQNGKGVDIYILDSGVMRTHNEFGNNVVNGPSNKKFANGFDDDVGHGTCVASVASGYHFGVSRSSRIVTSKVMSATQKIMASRVLRTVLKIVKFHNKQLFRKDYHGAIINMSFGFNGKYNGSSAIQRAVNSAIENGIHVVVAAGNSNADACDFSPSSNPDALTIGSSSRNDRKSYFSNYGSCVDLYAPGEDITCASTHGNNALEQTDGTSFSSPLVAGIMASFLSFAPYSGTKFTKGTQITPQMMKVLLKRVATPSASNKLLRTEIIAYHGGTLDQLKYFYQLLEKDPLGQNIKTPQFQVQAPSLAASAQILAAEQKAYSSIKTDELTEIADNSWAFVKETVAGATGAIPSPFSGAGDDSEKETQTTRDSSSLQSASQSVPKNSQSIAESKVEEGK